MDFPTRSSPITIRPATSQDKPFLEKLYHCTRDDLKTIEGDKEFVDELIQMQFRAQTEGYGNQFPNAMYFIVEKLQQPIGKISVDFGHSEIRIIDIAFIKEAQNKGFGQEILKYLQNAAATVCTPLTLSVMNDNYSAKAVYQKLGFVVESISAPYELLIWHPKPENIRVFG